MLLYLNENANLLRLLSIYAQIKETKPIFEGIVLKLNNAVPQ